MSVTLNVAEATNPGETVYVVGSIAQLGSWNTDTAVALSAGDYTSEYPRWYVTVDLPAGTAFQYKYLKKGADGSAVYEGGGNRGETVPQDCKGWQEVRDLWQS